MANTIKGDDPRTIRTPKTRARFLLALEGCGNVTESCRVAELGRSGAYEWRRDEPELAPEWDEALQAGMGLLEDEVLRRALNGTSKPVFQDGVLVGYVPEFSDTLAMFLLKANKPAKYRDNVKIEHSGSVTVDQIAKMTGDEARATLSTTSCRIGTRKRRNNGADKRQQRALGTA